jgi:hypothetical protein
MSGPRKFPLRRRRPTELLVPIAAWPRRMPAELAARYVGERNTKSFLRRVGREYPGPQVKEGRRQIWLRDHLDEAILPQDFRVARDVAEDL